MKSIKQFFKALFNQKSQQSDLEHFILSHNPTSVGDVEYWTERFDRLQQYKARNNMSNGYTFTY